MNNVSKVLKNMSISSTSVNSAIRDTKKFLEKAGLQYGANVLFKQLADRDIKFDTEEVAEKQALSLVEVVVTKKCVYEDSDLLLKEVQERFERFQQSAAKLGIQKTTSEKKSTVAGEVSKKGKAPNPESKQQKVFAEYEKVVVAGKMPNADFVKHIIEVFGLTKLGARTYAYNAKNAYNKKQESQQTETEPVVA